MYFEALKREVVSVLQVGRCGYIEQTQYCNKLRAFLNDFEVNDIAEFCERYPDAIPQLYNFLIRIKSQL